MQPPPVGVPAALGPAALLVSWRTSGAPRRKGAGHEQDPRAGATRRQPAHRGRPLPLQRRQPLPPLREAGRAPGDGRRRRGRATSRSGRPDAERGRGRSATSTAGTRAATRCALARPVRHLGGLRPRRRRQGALYKYHMHSRYRRLPGGQGRPVRLSLRDPAAHRLDRLGPRLRVGRRGVDGDAARAQRARRADVDLRGALGSWRRVPEEGDRCAHLPRAGARAGRVRARDWASPTSSSCRSWSIPSTAPGATRPPATSRPPAATARPRTSCTSIDTCTSTASA